jgi:hypothetical protein
LRGHRKSVARDPERPFATDNYRTAKGSFDHFVSAAEQRERVGVGIEVIGTLRYGFREIEERLLCPSHQPKSKGSANWSDPRSREQHKLACAKEEKWHLVSLP